jgi:hypothetical protein
MMSAIIWGDERRNSPWELTVCNAIALIGSPGGVPSPIQSEVQYHRHLSVYRNAYVSAPPLRVRLRVAC